MNDDGVAGQTEHRTTVNVYVMSNLPLSSQVRTLLLTKSKIIFNSLSFVRETTFGG